MEVPNLISGFLTAQQAAKAIGVSPDTLKRWRGLGKGPRPCWIGGKLYYRQRDLEAWVEEEATRDRPAMPSHALKHPGMTANAPRKDGRFSVVS